MSRAAWELVFMLVVLKLPIVYVCAVVYWAVRAEPRPLEAAALTVPADDGPRDRAGRRPPRPPKRRPGPHGTRPRAPRRRSAPARAEAER